MREQGARRRIRPSYLTLVSAFVVAVTFGLLLHEMLVDKEQEQWIGLGAAVGFALGAVTLFVALQQYAASQYPYISYERDEFPTDHLGDRGTDPRWCIDVFSLGGGLAIVGGTTYDIEIHHKPESARYGVTFDEMREVLESSGIPDEPNVHLKHWHPGYGLMPSREPKRLWDFPLPVAQQIKTLTARMRYTSRVGGLVEITINAIPPSWTPPPRPGT